MTDEEQAAWDADGVGQAPSHNPASSIAKVLLVFAALLIVAFALSALVGRTLQ